METSREDIGILIRSALLKKGTRQRFSLIVLIICSFILIYIDTFEAKPLSYVRSVLKDTIYRGSAVVSLPSNGLRQITGGVKEHLELFDKYKKLEKENNELKEKIIDPDYLLFENELLKKLIQDQVYSSSYLVSARVLLDKQSPYLNSFIINSGSNKNIKNGMAVLDGKNFVGRTVDVNFFSSRILLVTDLNSKIPVIIEPSGHHAILSGTGTKEPVLDFLPKEHTLKLGNKVYTSGKAGIFSPGIPIGEVNKIDNKEISISLFTDISQITFINVNLQKERD